MNRWWLVPYAEREIEIDSQLGLVETGVGKVGWNRPIARSLQSIGISVRIHQILRSDQARASHNHPWRWFISIILRGGYIEYIYDNSGFCRRVKVRKKLSVAFYTHSHWHRLELPPGSEVYTLFIMGPRLQGWGFNDEGLYIPHEEYAGEV